MTDSDDKRARTEQPIHQLLAARWSPRAFDPDRRVTPEEITALLEAARWAPSCYGDQPWRYVVCDRSRDPAAFERAAACLSPGNREWAQRAPLLLLSIAHQSFDHNGKPNRWAGHDVGAASENLCLQAVVLGLAAHQMGGFDAERARRELHVPEDFEPMAMIAVGHPGDPTVLDDKLRQRELAARSRRPLREIAFGGRFGEPLA